MREGSSLAKINLSLSITGRRSDGYHLLHSVVAFAQIGDSLRVRESDGLRMTCEGPFARGLDDCRNNSVMAAARLLRGETNLGADITLRKNLPIAAGLGGGSGDAALALRLLNELWELHLSDERLADYALRIGADVPACLYGRCCVMEGIGEVLTPLPHLPAWFAVLVNPGVFCPTRQIFARYRDSGAVFAPIAPMPGDLDFAEYLSQHGNDLETSAIDLHPVTAEVIAALNALPHARFARMSGSGATCFALFETAEQAAAAAAALFAEHADWWVVSAPII